MSWRMRPPLLLLLLLLVVLLLTLELIKPLRLRLISVERKEAKERRCNEDVDDDDGDEEMR